MTALLPRVRFWRAALLAIATLTTTLVAAPTPASAEDNPPVAYGGSVEPTSLDYNGGQVTITASAIDDYGIFMFYADVNGPDGFVQSVQMWPSYIPDNPNEPSTYTGIFMVPGNSYPYPVDYYFNSAVTDTGGGTASAYLGSVTVGELQRVDEPPYLWEPTLSAKTLPSSGGPLTLGVSTFDDTSVAAVSATVAGPGGFTKQLDLQPVDQTVYSGTLSLPANTSTTPAEYTVTFIGYDDISQSTTLAGGTVTVAAANAPPLGQLQVTPANQIAGPVRAGSAVRRNVVVRNLGKPGSGTVVATATVSGSLFSIIGAGPFGQPLELAPGQSKILVVEFRPKRGGIFSGRVTVTRPDGRQRPQIAQLTGVALP